MKQKMTLVAANHLIEQCERLFYRSARAWERGSQSGKDPAYNARCLKQQEAYQQRAEALLTPLGVAVDYPGLYPSFTVNGITHHTTESAVSAALE